jgi:caffeoyl-CoA O-methyltransferase
LTGLNPEVEAYLLSWVPPRDRVLQVMEEMAAERDFPIIGPLVGPCLTQFARLTRARRIVELGSGFGYSAVWLARGLAPGGEIICTDKSRRNAQLARRFFAAAGLAGRIRFEVGDALVILDRLPGRFDIILNDVDKADYPLVLDKAVPRLRKGGLLITDNVLWQGQVLAAASRRGPAHAVREYTRLAYADPRLLTTILPIRDGVAVSLRVG